MKQIYALLFLLGLATYTHGQVPAANEDTTNSQISAVFDVEAEFPGGLDALHKFIKDSIDLTEVMEFSDEEMYNKVTVRFLVTKDGSIENAIISKAGAYCPPCNQEALRLVRSMPNWTPATLNGRPVSMFFSLPIIFAVL
ncbi:MAG: energy transducer TonB [Flavobacteriales bacterium]